MEFQLKPDDPLLPQARDFALKHGLSKDAFKELVGLHASGQVAMQQSLAAFEAGEVQKLGVNGPQRKTAVDNWLVATLGDDVGKHWAATMKTVKHVEGVEKLMALDRGSAGRFSHQHREAPADAGTIPGYATMSFEQRRQAQDAIRQRSNAR
jgi:hypothetical protein